MLVLNHVDKAENLRKLT